MILHPTEALRQEMRWKAREAVFHRLNRVRIATESARRTSEILARMNQGKTRNASGVDR